VQAVGDGVGGEVEEGHEDGGHVVLVLRQPRGRNHAVGKDGRAGRERGDGRVQGPRRRGRDGGAARGRGRGGCGRISLLGG
jgi:hypothetical protein